MNDHDDLEAIVQELHHKRDWRVRQQAVAKLVDVGTDQALKLLLSALYDESPHVVQTAAKGLQSFGERAIPGLLEALYSPEDIASRRFIIHALDDIGDANLVPHFVHFLEQEDEGLQYAAALALTKIPDERAVPHLIKALNKPGASVAQIAQALTQTGSPAAVPALKPFLLKDDQAVRRYCSIALGHIGTEDALQALLEASSNSRAEVRANAAEGLGILNEDRAYQRLVEMLEEDDPQVKGMTVNGLGITRRSEAVPMLISQLGVTDVNVKPMLHHALADTGDLRVIPHLVRYYREDMLGSQPLFNFARNYFKYGTIETEQAVSDAILALESIDQRLRIAAVWLLYSFNYDLYGLLDAWDKAGQPREQFDEPELHTRVMQILVELLDDDNPDIRLSVMEPLQRTGDMRTIAGIVKNLDHDDELIVQKAVLVLGQIQDQRAVPEIIKATSSSNRTVRNHAMGALAKIGGEEAYQTLVALLDHEDEWTRGSAAFNLGNLGDGRAVSPLLEKLNSEHDKTTRGWIITGLGRLADKRAVPDIIRVLEANQDEEPAYPDPFDAALHALMGIQDETALPTLYKIVNSASRWQLRMDAVNAIGAIGSPREIADRMFELLEHEDDTVRTAASTRLGYLGAGATDLDLRDYIVTNLIQRLQDDGYGYHYMPHVAHAAAKSLYYVGTTEAIEALKNWEFKQGNSDENGEG